MRRALAVTLVIAGSIAQTLSSVETAAPQKDAVVSSPAPRAVLDQYCVTCHNEKLHTAGLALDTLDVGNPSANPEVWEKVIAKLQQGSMPPQGRPRPDAATYHAVAAALENDID